jgi:hypothetical protein
MIGSTINICPESAQTKLWCFLMAEVTGLGRSIVNPTFARGLNLIVAISLAYFGVNLLLQTMRI